MTYVVAIPGLKVLSSKTDTYKGVITLKILVEYDNQALGRLVREKLLKGAIEEGKTVRSTERRSVVGFDESAGSSGSKGTDKKTDTKTDKRTGSTPGFGFELPNAGKKTATAEEEKPPGMTSMMPKPGSLELALIHIAEPTILRRRAHGGFCLQK